MARETTPRGFRRPVPQTGEPADVPGDLGRLTDDIETYLSNGLPAELRDSTKPAGAALADRAVTHTSILAPWLRALRTNPSTAKVALVGPSTVDIVAAGISRHARWRFWMHPGGYLEGMLDANLLNFGYNGQTAAQITSAAHMADLKAAAPGLINASGLLINTVRATAWTLAPLIAHLKERVEVLRAACPGVPIVLETGNAFLSGDTNGSNYVQPANEAQAKMDLIRLAHLAVIDTWPDVLVRDVINDTYGLVALATHPHMADQIHPNVGGMNAEVDALMTLVGYQRPMSTGHALAARIASPVKPWDSYPREVEDPARYSLVATGLLRDVLTNVGTAPNQVDFVQFDWPRGQTANIKPFDIVELPGGFTFQMPRSGTTFTNQSATVLRIAVPLGTIPAGGLVNRNRGYVRVYRASRPVDQAPTDALLDTSWAFRRIGRYRLPTGAAAATTISIEAGHLGPAVTPGTAAAFPVQNGDRFYFDGLHALLGGGDPGTTYYELGANGITAAASGSDLQLAGLPALDRSSLVGRLVVIVGNRV